MSKEFTYGYWRTEKEKEPGFSHELISCDSEELVRRGSNLDELYATPFEGEFVDTLLKAL